MNPLKVLFVTSTFPRFEGDDQVPWLLELSLVLRESFDVDLEVLAPTYSGLSSHEIYGIPVHRYRYWSESREIVTHEAGAMNKMAGRGDLALPAFSLVGAGMVAAARLARENRYDVIHSHWPLPMGLPAQAGFWASKKSPKLVATFHGAELALAKRKPRYAPVLRWLSKNLDASIANSSSTAATTREVAKISPEVIPWGPPRGVVDLDRRAEEGFRDIEGGLPLVLAVGRIIERKGFPTLVRAARRLRGKARVVIAGGGEDEERLRGEIERQRVADVVRLAGRVTNDELASLYRRCAVFCLPATIDARGETEGLGVVLIEAMSYGKPVVASDLGGIPDAVKDGESGLLVPHEDPQSLADALLRVIADEDLAKRFGEAGKKRAGMLFSWEEISRRHLEIYTRPFSDSRTETRKKASR